MVIYFEMKILFFYNSELLLIIYPDTLNFPDLIWAFTLSCSRVQLRKPGERATKSKVIFCFLEGHLLPWPILQHANSSAECNFPSISGPVNIITLLILNFKWSAQVKECPFISQDSAINWENRGSTCQEFARNLTDKGEQVCFLSAIKPLAHNTQKYFRIFLLLFFFFFLHWKEQLCSEWLRKITFTDLVLSRLDWSRSKERIYPRVNFM